MPIIGHAKIIATLQKEIQKQSYAQAYIFSGPEEVGKATIAREFAGGMIAGKDFAKLSDQERHWVEADMLQVGSEIEEKKGIVKEKDISIEQIRSVQKELANFPYRGKVKVLIIDNGDRMNLKAQNALLKTMEEPNSTSIIILITSRLAKILPTIQSRCQTINFGLVSPEELKKYIQAQGLKVEDKIADFAMGRPGVLLEILEDPEKITWFQDAREKMNRALNGKINEKFKLADELSKNVPEAMRCLEFWLWEIHSRKDRTQISSAGKISETLEKMRNTNANPKLALEALFLKL